MGAYVDSVKFAGGSFCLMPDEPVREIIDICHRHEVVVSTGGFLERALLLGPTVVERCLAECRRLGFDTIEVSSGFIAAPRDDLLALAKRALDRGFHVKPEVGVQFGAGGGSPIAQLEAEAPRAADDAIRMAERYLTLGVPLVMIESEGLTENVRSPRHDVIAKIVAALGLNRVMFEAADPAVFTWYVKTYGPDINLFVDHSHIVQLEALRAGLWGTADVWGRIVTFKPSIAITRRAMSARMSAHVPHPSVCRRVSTLRLLILPSGNPERSSDRPVSAVSSDCSSTRGAGCAAIRHGFRQHGGCCADLSTYESNQRSRWARQSRHDIVLFRRRNRL
jgi:phosphosulfolactate synthase (CoM biosynthesis protein A)